MPDRAAPDHLWHMATKLSRHTAAYALGIGIALAIGLVNSIVLVFFVAPAEFGRIGICFVISSFVALAPSLFIRRGAISRTYGRPDADGDEEEDDDDQVGTAPTSREPRAALGTGFILTVAAGAVATGLLVAFGRVATRGVGLGVGLTPDLLALAGALGLVLALWELVIMIPRAERRPRAFIAANAARALTVLAVTVAFVAESPTAGSALLGYLVGYAVSLLALMTVFRHSMRLTFVREEVRPIVTLSMRRIPRRLGNWTLNQADMIAVASVATASELGWYRLAGRVVAPIAFPALAFFMAMGPLERSPLVRAADSARGRQDVRALAATYMVFFFAGALLAVLVGLDVLGGLLPEEYAGATQFVPLLAGVALAHVALQSANRFARFAHRRRVYDITLILGGALSIPTALLLASWLGPKGAALGVLLVLAAGAAVMWTKSQRGSKPVPFEPVRLLAAGVWAGLCLGFVVAGEALAPSAGIAIGVAALAAYPLGLILLEIIPREHRPKLLQLPRSAMLGGDRDTVRAALTRLDPDQHAALRAALAGRPARPVEEDEGADQPARNVADLAALSALRVCADCPVDAPEHEPTLARYLFESRPFLDDHQDVYRLYRARVSPKEIATLERWRDEIRAWYRRARVSSRR